MLFRNLNKRLANAVKLPLNDFDLDMLQQADLEAQHSTVPKHKMGAVVYKRKAYYGRGSNKAKTHPLQHRFCPRTLHTHAETVAMLQSLQSRLLSDLVGASIAVSRQKEDRIFNTAHGWIPAVSYPCEECLSMLCYAGFACIVCRDEYGDPVKIDIRGGSNGN